MIGWKVEVGGRKDLGWDQVSGLGIEPFLDVT